ncbi:calcium-binding protein [Azospirillum sp. ST 5-10]|uniref:calcium-binding protein n=1 Tax=unclassified Azospirillum TaxID=2630922 RepID=UPI003F4A3E72
MLVYEDYAYLDETLYGSSGDDIFLLSEIGPGTNFLYGLAGADIFLGLGQSPTVVYGGSGNDTFGFAGTTATSPAYDRIGLIEDFSSGDEIRISTTGQPTLVDLASIPDYASAPYVIGYMANYVSSSGTYGVLLAETNGDTTWDHVVTFSSVSSLNMALEPTTVGKVAIFSVGGSTVVETPIPVPDGAISGSTSGDNLVGTGDGDEIYGLQGADTISGMAGDDALYGNFGMDSLAGDAGNDSLFGGQDGDTMFGGSGDDDIYGQIASDSLVGGDGADEIFGGQGGDTISGGEGNDWLTGNRDDDLLYGGAGADTFVFRETMGTDTIADFNAAEGDKIELLGSQTYVLTESEGNAMLRFDSGDQLVLAGHRASEVNDGWFTVL